MEVKSLKPSGSKKIGKTAHLHLRVSEKQKEGILKKAKLAKLTLTSFVLKSTEKVDIERLLEKEQKFLVGMEIGKELNKIGVNINQLTKQVNAAKYMSQENVNLFFILARQIEQRQNALMKLLNS